MATTPAVSIGMPVFNGEVMVGEAIETILAQDFADFELLISDNASTDNTQVICEAYAASDIRISYVRQPRNLGPVPNFLFVAEHARADLFLWAAVDDTRSIDFLRVNVAQIRSHPDLVGSISPSRFDNDPEHAIAMGDNVLDAPSAGERMARFLRRSHPNSVFYAVFRRSALLEALKPIAWYFGFDWTVMLRLAKVGRVSRLKEGWLQRGSQGMSNRADIVSVSRTRPVNWLLPFYDVSREAIKLAWRIDRRSRMRVAGSLLRLNFSAFRVQARYEARRLLKRGA